MIYHFYLQSSFSYSFAKNMMKKNYVVQSQNSSYMVEILKYPVDKQLNRSFFKAFFMHSFDKPCLFDETWKYLIYVIFFLQERLSCWWGQTQTSATSSSTSSSTKTSLPRGQDIILPIRSVTSLWPGLPVRRRLLVLKSHAPIVLFFERTFNTSTLYLNQLEWQKIDWFLTRKTSCFSKLLSSEEV